MKGPFDLAVLGGGPGGYAAAIRGSQLGLKVALIDPRPPGGVCLHEGCIPSKALLHAAKLAHQARHEGGAMGIHIEGVRVDGVALQKWKSAIVKKLSDGIAGLLSKHGVEVFPHRGTLAHASAIDLLDEAGRAADRVGFKNLILATGSREKTLRHLAAAGDLLWTPRDALSFTEVPKRLVIVGAGIIGLELGQLFSRIGAEVHLVEALPDLLPGRDRIQVAQLKKSLEAEGLHFHMGCKATGVSGMTLRVSQDGVDRSLPFERLLVSVGRSPRTEDLGLEKLNIDMDSRGLVRINTWLQTTLPHIFAIGDITDGPQLAHRATRMGTLAAENATGARYPWDVRGMPGVLYTDPPLAWVGMGVEEARGKGLSVKTGVFPMAANGRALTENQGTGMVQVVSDGNDGRLLGVEALGEGAEGMAAMGAQALELSADSEDLAHVVAPHPSVFEALGEAAHAVEKMAIHIFQRPVGKHGTGSH